MLDQFKLDGRVAVVTGASRGLGQGMAVGLAGAGAKVALVARTLSSLEETAARIGNGGGEAKIIQADLFKVEEADRVIAETMACFGKVDILVNAAGTQVRKPAFEMTEKDWDYLMGVNLKAPYFISLAAAREMAKAKRGKIINITSLTSFIGVSNISIYGASKGGLASLTRQWAVEWAKYNINVNAIGPGYFMTELTAALFADPEKAKWVLSKIPLGRTGLPEDLMGTVIFLASAASDYITGQIINVDGGWLSA